MRSREQGGMVLARALEVNTAVQGSSTDVRGTLACVCVDTSDVCVGTVGSSPSTVAYAPYFLTPLGNQRRYATLCTAKLVLCL
eukprot:3648519-Rhodomonas_salina.1